MALTYSSEQKSFLSSFTFERLSGGKIPCSYLETYPDDFSSLSLYLRNEFIPGTFPGFNLLCLWRFISQSDINGIRSVFYNRFPDIPFSTLWKSHSADLRGLNNKPRKDKYKYFINAYILLTLLYHFISEFHAPKFSSVNSFYRSVKVNKIVGGKTNSRHLSFRAVDLSFRNSSDCETFYKLLQSCPYFRYFYKISDISIHVDI